MYKTDSICQCMCSLIMHKGCQNVVSTSAVLIAYDLWHTFLYDNDISHTTYLWLATYLLAFTTFWHHPWVNYQSIHGLLNASTI